MNDRRFWSGFVWISGLAVLAWNVYVLFRIHSRPADLIFRILMLLLIGLIIVVAYAQWRGSK